MKLLLGLFRFVLVVLASGISWAVSAAVALPRATPESQGVASTAILSFVEEVDQKSDSLHSLMILRHGHVIAEGWWAPYDARSPHELYSLSKSFTSTAVGLAVAEGKLSVDDEVLKFFPEDAPAAPSGNLKSMRLRDLLCMSAGHEKEIPSSPEAMTTRAFLAHPVPFEPGTRFLYNTPATFMLSAIVQKVTGQTVLEYLRPRLFEPLGIENPTWGTNVQGISLGGYGLNLRTEDLARFSQLYLQQGRWNGKQVLPTAWVEAATSRQTSNGSNPKSDWDQGYGFQFWRSRHGAYRGDGAFGQYCLVLPEQDVVIAITSGLKDMQSVLNLVWDRLLPALNSASLPEDPSAQQRLSSRLAGLSLAPAAGAASSTQLGSLVGRKFVFPTNDQKLEALTLERDPSGVAALIFRYHGVDQRVLCGLGEWKRGRLKVGQLAERAVALSGAWPAADQFIAKICFYETPFVLTLKLRFTGNQVSYEPEYNVAFGPSKQPPLLGRAD